MIPAFQRQCCFQLILHLGGLCARHQRQRGGPTAVFGEFSETGSLRVGAGSNNLFLFEICCYNVKSLDLYGLWISFYQFFYHSHESIDDRSSLNTVVGDPIHKDE